MNEQELRSCQCCFTGHRPEKLKRAEEEIKEGLEEAILKAVSDGYTTFITGMARWSASWRKQYEEVLKAADLVKDMTNFILELLYKQTQNLSNPVSHAIMMTEVQTHDIFTGGIRA